MIALEVSTRYTSRLDDRLSSCQLIIRTLTLIQVTIAWFIDLHLLSRDLVK